MFAPDPGEPSVVVETHTLSIVAAEDVNTQLVLTFSGDNLTFNDVGVPVGGTITDFSLAYDFDQALLAELYGPDVNAEDRAFSQGIDVAYPMDGSPADLSVNLFLLTFAIRHSQLVDPDADANRATSFFLGADDVAMTFGALDDYVHLSGAGYDLNLRGGDDDLDARDSGAGGVAILGGGDDRFEGSAFADSVRGSSGDDYMLGNAGNDHLRGEAGNDVLWAGEGNDVLRGRDGDDVLYSGTGVNSVQGSAGRDVLIASETGSGIDRLSGGDDADCFVFSVGAGQRDGGISIVRDFDLSEDVLRLGPTNNGTYDADDAYARFMDGATQRGDHVRFIEDGYHILIRNVDLDDLTVDHFIGPEAGSYFDWAGA